MRAMRVEGERSGDVLVRMLDEDDLEALWALRLRALRDDPEAFGTTYDEALAGGSGELRRRLWQTSEAGFYLGAVGDGGLIGMVRFSREEGAKDRHKGEISSLYVATERREGGVGRALAREVIARARGMAGVEQLHLAVVATNVAAISLYRSLGFTVYGTAPRSLKQGERYWDEALMVLALP